MRCPTPTAHFLLTLTHVIHALHDACTDAVNFLQGIQYGKDPKHTQIVGTCKHFVANSMENWYNYSRHNYDAKVSKADLADYYFPAFKACVMEGKAMSIMCSCALEFTFPVLRATCRLV